MNRDREGNEIEKEMRPRRSIKEYKGVLMSWLGEGNGTPLQDSCLKIPWMEELGGLQSMGSLRVRHD